MARCRPFPLFVAMLGLFLFFISTEGTRQFDRRSDLKVVPPVSELGWSVPLVGDTSCVPGSGCYNSLSRPAENKTLEVLAIGRGSFNYSCEGAMPANPPKFIAQYTELYNAAAIAAKMPNDQSFHELIPAFLEYDYETLANSTLECIGSIGTLDGLAVLTLYEIDTFTAEPAEAVKSPKDQAVNGLWSHSLGQDSEWEVYRVEMAGGAVPDICAGQNVTFDSEYVAEYWFYR